MKINIVANNSTEHIQVDIQTIQLQLRKLKEKPEVSVANASHYKCNNASINLFVNTINPLFFHHAKMNVGLYDPSCIQKSELYMLCDLDFIYVKSDYAKNVFETEMRALNYDTSRIINIGCSSPDMSIPGKKSFDKVLMFCAERDNLMYEKIASSWKESYPTLYIVNALSNPQMLTIHRENLAENVVFCDKINNDKFHSLFNSCGFHLCISESNAYDHMVNQCKTIGSIPIAMKGSSRDELLHRDFAFILGGKKRKGRKHALGSTFSTQLQSVHDVMTEILCLSETSIENMARDARINAKQQHGTFNNTCKRVFSELLHTTRQTKKKARDSFNDEELPSVTIVTVTHQRKKNFPLAIFNYNSLDYPEDKKHWVIVEDVKPSQESIEDLLPSTEKRSSYNIHYEKVALSEEEDKKSIGWKRNLALKYVKTDYILMLDDDDYIYPDSLRKRMTEFLNVQRDLPHKNIAGMNIIGCFDVNRYISMINISPSNLSLGERIAEGTLLFHKSYLDNGEDLFEDTSENEAKNFLNTNKHNFVEQSWENRFVSILHSSNQSGRKPPDNNEANGCHFKFSEKLFDFICKIFKEEKKETNSQEGQSEVNDNNETIEETI